MNVTPTLRQRRKQARPQELLDAALALFVERGFAATRAEEVAKRAGVSKGTLYLYYPSKEELFKAVVRHNLSAQIIEGMEIAAAFEGSTADLLALVLRTWWERVGEGPSGGIVKIMMAESGNFPELAQFYAEEVILPAQQLLGSVIERGVQRGEFRPVKVADTVHVLCSPLLFLSLQQQSFGACGVYTPLLVPESVLNTQIDLMLRGLMSDRPVASPSP
nr:TetR/AcrR family transcriptional regulator [uncultured Roseateles sp.]